MNPNHRPVAENHCFFEVNPPGERARLVDWEEKRNGTVGQTMADLFDSVEGAGLSCRPDQFGLFYH